MDHDWKMKSRCVQAEEDVSTEIKLPLDVLVGIGNKILCVCVLILAVNLYAVMKSN